MARKITLGKGDCLSSIAFEQGFFIDTLWSHAQNAALRKRRENPYVLEAGDAVFIPELEGKQQDAATGQRHRFRRHGVPEWLRVQLVDAAGRPRAGLAYTLIIDETHSKSGQTDEGGWVIVPIPPNASLGVLTLPGGERHALQLGHLSPADSIRGLQQRLHNLGYRCGGDAPGELDAGTWQAIERFVLAEDGSVPPRSDISVSEIQQRLCQRHGS